MGVRVRLSRSRDVPASAFVCSYVSLTVVLLLVRTLNLAFVSSLGLTGKYLLKLFASSHLLPSVCLFFCLFFSPVGLYPQGKASIGQSSRAQPVKIVQVKVFLSPSQL